MEKTYNATSCFTVDKYLLSKIKDDEAYKEYIIKELSNNLAHHLVDILSSEGEVLVSMSDVRCHDNNDFATVDYRRYLKWSHLVRCKDCKWWNDMGCAIRIVDDSDKPEAGDYCSFGERREDAEVH